MIGKTYPKLQILRGKTLGFLSRLLAPVLLIADADVLSCTREQNPNTQEAKGDEKQEEKRGDPLYNT